MNPSVPDSAGAPRQLRPTEVKRLNREWRRAGEGRLALLLDSVAQPFNVGSIIRTAAAFGAEHLWLCGSTAPLSHPGVARTAGLANVRCLPPGDSSLPDRFAAIWSNPPVRIGKEALDRKSVV